MKVSPFAGNQAEASMLVNVPKLITAYYTDLPDAEVTEQQVDGSLPDRQALKISARSMRKASVVRTICTASWRKRR